MLERKKKAKQHADYIRPMLQFCVWIQHKKRDTISISKEMADSVRLDPWPTGNCPVCFG
jgi:hypothetical protein